MEQEIIKAFGNKLRLRVCGICLREEKLLLVKHHSLGPKGVFWSPPGGGLRFGETARESLKREFLEETGLEIEAGRFLFVHEFLHEPLHAIELFFEVKLISGSLKTGMDPEMPEDKQIIQQVDFLSPDEIGALHPDILHNVFRHVSRPIDLINLSGYMLFKP